MDYLILSDLAFLTGYLLWLGWKVSMIGKPSVYYGEPPVQPPAAPDNKTFVKILRVGDKGQTTIVARVPADHETVGLALASSGLAVEHPDGRIQHTALEGK